MNAVATSMGPRERRVLAGAVRTAGTSVKLARRAGGIALDRVQVELNRLDWKLRHANRESFSLRAPNPPSDFLLQMVDEAAKAPSVRRERV